MKKLFLSLLCLLLVAATTGDLIKLSWDPNPVTDKVTKYNIYEKLAAGTLFLNIGSTTLTEFPVSNTLAGDSFYATAVNQWGESKPSNIVVYVPPTPTHTPTPTPTPNPPTNLKATKL
jgi:hypothetical protein